MDAPTTSTNMADPMFALLSQTLSGLQNSLTAAMNAKQQQPSTYGLHNYYHQQPATNPSMGHSPFIDNPTQKQTFGVAPDDAPSMELVSTSMRQRILEGKDINLAALLIPSFDFDKDDDKNLSAKLNIIQFMRAFGRFKRIMCGAYKDRRDELDRYEAIIQDIHHLHGDIFYEYHKMFSLKSATALQVHKMKLDWSKRDSEIYHVIVAKSSGKDRASYSACGFDTDFAPAKSVKSPQHDTVGQSASSAIATDPDMDRHGRMRFFHQNREICNNFNGKTGCNRAPCPRLHVCLKCRKGDHSVLACPMNLTRNQNNPAGFKNRHN